MARRVVELLLRQKPFQLAEAWGTLEGSLRENPEFVADLKPTIIANALWYGVKKRPKETAELLFSLLVRD